MRETLAVLTRGVAHDFNNILVGILGNVELVLDGTPESSPSYMLLEEVRDAALRAAHLTRQMLACSGGGGSGAQHSGVERLALERVSLNQLLESMATLLESVASRGARLHFSFEPELPEVEVDRAKLRHVLLNLAMNAYQALEEHPGAVFLETGVLDVDADYVARVEREECLSLGRYVYVEVTDTGRGMDADTQAQMFEPFFTTKPSSRGLGLAAARGIVRAHRGAITVRTELGRGSAFRVLLPAAQARENTQREDEGATIREPKLILVADDEPTVLRVAGRILSNHGYRVLFASHGRQAVETYAAHAEDIALVLLDMSMPELSGREVLEEIRRIRPDVRVVFSSGHGESEATRHVEGVAEFLQKPWLPGDLLAAVARTLDV